MTWVTDAKAIAKVQVGDDAARSYAVLHPVLAVVEQRGTADGVPGSHGRRVTWRLRVGDEAANYAAVAALMAQMQADMARVGSRVRLTLHGANTDLPAQGTSGAVGSSAGYPRCTLDLDEPVGNVVFGVLSCETFIPAAVGGGGASDSLVLDDYTVETMVDDLDRSTTRRVGELRVLSTFAGGARAWAMTNIITPARTAALAAGRSFKYRFVERPESALCEYDYTDAAYSTAGGGSGVTDAEVIDVEDRESRGRTQRVVSGYAVGIGAASFATAQRPSVTAPDLLIAERVSQPRSSDGRVEFSYTVLKGKASVSGAPSGAVIYAYTESLREVAGGRELQPSEYPSAAPLLKYGDRRVYVYEQTTTCEYRGCTEAAMEGATIMGALSMTGCVLVRQPVISHARGNSTITTTITRTWASATRLSPMPATREVLAL